MSAEERTVKTRFAPSPTGHLHIGGARTALFNWLFARSHQGAFVLRVEDTDTARSTEESMRAILDGMEWLGLDYDEGPYFQSQRFDLYREFGEKLLKEGRAYRCYCTAAELEERRAAALRAGRPVKYDGKCKGGEARPDRPFTVRFNVAPGKTGFKDLIKGPVMFDNSEIEDLVILRSDMTPTYNLCVVVDDATMGITHVLRGDDHLNNTPKQIMLYEALGLPLPRFAHLPMILGEDKTRLSKRHGATSVTAYREMGYLPQGLINYLARLGWAHGDQEIFSRDELVEHFTLDNVGKASGVFNPEKLLWLNTHYIKTMEPSELATLVTPFLEKEGFDVASDERLPKIVATLQERAATLEEMARGAAFYFRDEFTYDEKSARKFLKPETAPLLTGLADTLATLAAFDVTSIQTVFERAMEATGLKLGKLAQPVRVALTGGTVSPGIYETLEALGREKSIERLRRAIDFIGKLSAPGEEEGT